MSHDIFPNGIEIQTFQNQARRIVRERLPIGYEEFAIADSEAYFVLITQHINYALRDRFGQKRNSLCVEVARFERDYDNKYLVHLVTDGNSRDRTWRNPIHEVKTRHHPIETLALQWSPVEPLKELRLGKRSFNLSGWWQS